MTLCIKGDFATTAAVPLKVGLAVVDVLAQFAPSRFRIKWPNDIMGFATEEPRRAAKLGGILCENARGWLLAGIGLNLRAAAYANALQANATSLEEVVAASRLSNDAAEGEPTRETHSLCESGCAEALALEIGRVVTDRFERTGWQADYMDKMWAMNEEVSFLVGHPDRGVSKTGRIAGIDDLGRLVLSLEGGGEEAFWSGEISQIRNA
jgi:biotin-(acetyl-CoA carboxylase) ligase